MSIFEYDEEDTRRAIREYEHEQGKAEDVLFLLERKGVIPVGLKKEISEEKDIDVLREWLVIAAEVKSIDAFIERRQKDI